MNDANAKYYRKHGNIGLIVDPSDLNWKTVSPSGTPGVTYKYTNDNFCVLRALIV